MTIVVLIILATVSINAVFSENGIIKKAELAKEKQRAATVEDTVSMWKLDKQLGKGTGIGEAQTRDELLAGLLADKLITESEKATVEETGSVTIGGKVINFGTDAKTLVEMYNAAVAANCTGGDSCTDPENHLHIGDYVNYQNPTSGTYTVSGANTGMQRYKDKGNTVEDEDLNQVYNVANNQLYWRVLGVDEETGGLKLIAASPMKKETTSNNPYLIMYGAQSYVTGVDELNNICALYKNSLAITARSVYMADVNAITGVTTDDKIREVNLDAYYDRKQYGDTYSFTNQWTPESWLADSENPLGTISGTVDGYSYSVNSQWAGEPPYVTMTNTTAFNLLFNNVEYGGACYWLASRGVCANSDSADFGLGLVKTSRGVTVAGTYPMFYNDSSHEEYDGFAVRPVVILGSSVTEEDIQKIDDLEDIEIWDFGRYEESPPM